MRLVVLTIAIATGVGVLSCDSASSTAGALTPDIKVVAEHLADNKLGITPSDLRSLPNPRGEGTFVYCPTTRFGGVERLVVWLVLNSQAVPLNGATKGSVTPSLPWPREVPAEQWGKSGLDPYSPSEALTIVFGVNR